MSAPRIWIVLHLYAKNYRNWWKFDVVLTKTNLLSFFWDTVYVMIVKTTVGVAGIIVSNNSVRFFSCVCVYV